MLDYLDVIRSVLYQWGMLVGVAIAAELTYIISFYLWDTFHVGVFAGLTVPFSLMGLYLQYKIEHLNKKKTN